MSKQLPSDWSREPSERMVRTIPHARDRRHASRHYRVRNGDGTNVWMTTTRAVFASLGRNAGNRMNGLYCRTVKRSLRSATLRGAMDASGQGGPFSRSARDARPPPGKHRDPVMSFHVGPQAPSGFFAFAARR